MPHRPWLPTALDAQIERDAARYSAMSADDIDHTLLALLDEHSAYVDNQCINLYAGTNVPSPKVLKALGSSIGSRPSLGYPGDKYNMGMAQGEQIEIMLSALLRKLFRAKYVEHRVPSGSLANLYVYMAAAKPGDKIMAFDDAAAGHATHHAAGAAGLYGLRIHNIPFDSARMDIDLPRFAEAARGIRPALIIIAGSMCLFPYSVREVRAVADEIGATVLYDAAHMGGLIAGGEFQQPLDEGAHVMTGSTYKSFGGPPSGMVLTNDAALAQRIEAIAYPGLTANFDLSRTAAMCVAANTLLVHGSAYAKMMIANAGALAEALAAEGVRVFHTPARGGFTASQHVAIEAWRYGGGNAASRQLARANLLMSSIGLPGPAVPGDANGIRIGTQEVTRRGCTPDDMSAIARLIARVLTHGEAPERVADDTIALRAGFGPLCFVR
jgi:glycine hydroxymethyltransferase